MRQTNIALKHCTKPVRFLSACHFADDGISEGYFLTLPGNFLKDFSYMRNYTTKEILFQKNHY